MPDKKPYFKGDPKVTYTVNHPEAGEIDFETDSDGKYTPKNEKERDAITRVHPDKMKGA